MSQGSYLLCLRKNIQSGEKAVRETGIDEKFVSYYVICINCFDEFLEDIGGELNENL